MAPKIFISYRRSDAAAEAGRIYDRLAREFGQEHLFRDVDTIKLGVDFAATLSERVANCDVLLAVIGTRWLDETDEAGRRRLEQPDDYVRIEIATALERGIRVIPILIENTRLPPSNQLPEDLKTLPRRNGLHVRNDSFDANVATLIAELRSVRPTAPGPARASPKDFTYPLAAFGMAVLFLICSETGVLPEQQVLLANLKSILQSGSAAWLIAVSALQSTVAFNVYFPGALVILATMAATEGNPQLTAIVFACITTGQVIGYGTDYCIGYFFGRSLEAPGRSLKFESRYVKIDWPIPPSLLVMATFCHPHSAALTSYNLGTQAFSRWRFVMWGLCAVMTWGAFWTIVCLTKANELIKQTPWGRVFFAYVLIWIGWIAFRYYRSRKGTALERASGAKR